MSTGSAVVLIWLAVNVGFVLGCWWVSRPASIQRMIEEHRDH